MLGGVHQDGKPWSDQAAPFQQALVFKQYRRVEGLLSTPSGVVVKQVQVRVLDESGLPKASQTLRL